MSYPDLTDLDDVNAEVNALPYVADAKRYGQADFWARVDKDGGDCEDFALGKLNRLRECQWPIESLRLACCHVEVYQINDVGLRWRDADWNERYHAVLHVDLPDGTQRVLDNRQRDPQTIDDLVVIGYSVGTPEDKIQLLGGSRTWVEWKWVQ